MTGNDPARYRIHTALNVNPKANAVKSCANYLPSGAPTVTRALQAAGYRTGHFGKVSSGFGLHTSNAPPSPPPTRHGLAGLCCRRLMP